jgi:hypothetical protein
VLFQKQDFLSRRSQAQRRGQSAGAGADYDCVKFAHVHSAFPENCRNDLILLYPFDRKIARIVLKKSWNAGLHGPVGILDSCRSMFYYKVQHL